MNIGSSISLGSALFIALGEGLRRGHLPPPKKRGCGPGFFQEPGCFSCPGALNTMETVLSSWENMNSEKKGGAGDQAAVGRCRRPAAVTRPRRGSAFMLPLATPSPKGFVFPIINLLKIIFVIVPLCYLEYWQWSSGAFVCAFLLFIHLCLLSTCWTAGTTLGLGAMESSSLGSSLAFLWEVEPCVCQFSSEKHSKGLCCPYTFVWNFVLLSGGL